jgi:flagellar assembly protein FliH
LSETAVSFDLEPLEPSAPPREAAASLIAAAQAEADGIRERALRDGHEAGRAAGLEESRAQLASAAAALGEAALAVQAMRAEVAEEVEREAVELALALAGKIVVATLQIRPELVVEVLQGALRRVSAERTLAIVVNPADVETVRGALGELQSQNAAGERWDLQADQRVPAGGAIVRTAESEVDARIHVQLERAHEVVVAELGRRGSEP